MKMKKTLDPGGGVGRGPCFACGVNIAFYFINTKKIPGELSGKNMIHNDIFTHEDNMLISRVKRSLLL